jgi:hypothetical protein
MKALRRMPQLTHLHIIRGLDQNPEEVDAGYHSTAIKRFMPSLGPRLKKLRVAVHASLNIEFFVDGGQKANSELGKPLVSFDHPVEELDVGELVLQMTEEIHRAGAAHHALNILEIRNIEKDDAPSPEQWMKILASVPRMTRLEVDGTAALELMKNLVHSLETTQMDLLPDRVEVIVFGKLNHLVSSVIPKFWRSAEDMEVDAEEEPVERTRAGPMQEGVSYDENNRPIIPEDSFVRTLGRYLQLRWQYGLERRRLRVEIPGPVLGVLRGKLFMPSFEMNGPGADVVGTYLNDGAMWATLHMVPRKLDETSVEKIKAILRGDT